MPISLTRRQFVLGATGLLGAAALGDGFLVEPTAIQVSRHDLVVPGLGPDLENLRIACISDVHLHHGVPRAAAAALPRLAGERPPPDVVVLIGDICNRRSDLASLTAWARDARGTRATFATLGNWEHDAGIDRLTAERAYSQAGVELLYNSNARVGVGPSALTIVGIDDPVVGEPDVAAAVRGLDASDPALWVLHAPGYVDGIPRDRFPRPAAILAGHTHGGQVRLPFYTPYTPSGSGRFVAGWYRDTIAPLYVSRGIGTVLFDARLFCPPEIAMFTLRRA
ncbi:MAG: metallophosphoesterase [Gemmatimonadetes bacterium]|nr:MAG: metallophosphoesterase [Gemmatimonadota bacterium]PYP00161.1 MAG: metallophosphoesterase [Gemmatimonadota bacterium]TLY55395.1 MAG: metallophosphoesterase [Gemmatimonadota bacterium]